ncbi:MAG TPA: histidinol phosphate aminotransferase [Cytophagales bacterium]|nr:histidinol phosphate aminotransferase [Cytophagales bacterium]HAA18869.1 histidinol phosphate aminotransferase [Cytophagales bacterium]HAP62219.1 histidinol phosphate aminotransferase [Cytophagales bacterium]
MTHLTRRNWLKTGALTLTGTALLPHMGVSEIPRGSVRLNAQGQILHSPFLKEYLPMAALNAPALKAKLNANENPYGPSPKALEALKKASVTGNRYGWRELFALIDKLAEKEGVTPDHIMTGPGSSDLLEKVGMLSFIQGGNVVSADPSYMSLIKVAEAVGATWKPVKLKDDWSHDLDAMEQAIDSNTKLVYICNPNNPTGSITDAEKLRAFCKRVSAKVPVFVDEAYLDFIEGGEAQSMVSLVAEGYNVMVARTFSKIHGMAGLRFGYMMAQPEYIEEVQQITRGGMGISQTTIAAAHASLEDQEFLLMSRENNTKVRNHVVKSVTEMGSAPAPSYTSFIIFPIAMEGKAFLDQMYGHQVGVRAFDFWSQDWCRVSMGTMEEADIFLETLTKVLS